MLKEDLLRQCVLFVNEKSAIVEQQMTEARKALDQESKSSAGDKHETGRAMLHLEMEKASQQLEVVNQMRATLNRIDIRTESKKIKLGSLINTDQGIYFLAISAGQLSVDGRKFYAISAASPIGRQLLGKEKDQSLQLGEKLFKINSIA